MKAVMAIQISTQAASKQIDTKLGEGQDGGGGGVLMV